jgi:hypothetical protein
MMELHLPLDEKQYRYLQQRARARGKTVEDLVADLIDADIAWQNDLISDPIASLFGEISDTLDIREIDAILYPSSAS